MLNADSLTEDIVKASFIGELGKGFKYLLLDVLRKERISDMKLIGGLNKQ